MSTENNLHHITNGREILRPSALLCGGNPQPPFCTLVNNPRCGEFQLG
jgi:hypothetical protein